MLLQKKKQTKKHQDFWSHQNPHLMECLGVLRLSKSEKKKKNMSSAFKYVLKVFQIILLVQLQPAGEALNTQAYNGR